MLEINLGSDNSENLRPKVLGLGTKFLPPSLRFSSSGDLSFPPLILSTPVDFTYEFERRTRPEKVQKRTISEADFLKAVSESGILNYANLMRVEADGKGQDDFGTNPSQTSTDFRRWDIVLPFTTEKGGLSTRLVKMGWKGRFTRESILISSRCAIIICSFIGMVVRSKASFIHGTRER